jgi:hypothetical protein
MAKKATAYCSLEPVFPDQGHIVFLFVLHEGQEIGLVPLDGIYETTEIAAKAVDTVLSQLSETKNITVAEEALIIPITRKDLFHMQRSYWTTPSFTYDQPMRIRAFTPVAHYPEMYSLLVTPYVYNDETGAWHLNATLPFLAKDNAKNVIEQFMLSSDQIVDPRAKHSAIYRLGEKMQFNWRTGQTKLIEQSITKGLGITN